MHDVEILNHAQYNRQQQEKSNCCAVVGRCTEERKKTDTGQKLNPEYIESEHKKSN